MFHASGRRSNQGCSKAYRGIKPGAAAPWKLFLLLFDFCVQRYLPFGLANRVIRELFTSTQVLSRFSFSAGSGIESFQLRLNPGRESPFIRAFAGLRALETLYERMYLDSPAFLKPGLRPITQQTAGGKKTGSNW